MDQNQKTELTKFFNLLFPDAGDYYIEIRPCKDRSFNIAWKLREFYTSTEKLLEDIEQKITACRDSSSGCFFGVLPRILHAPPLKGGKKQILPGSVVFTDIDTKELPGGAQELEQILQNLPLEPSIIVRSRGGVHLYWLLTAETQPEDIERTNKAILKACKGDKSAWNMDRILRVPFSWHMKKDPWQVYLEKCDDLRYSLEEVQKAFPPTIIHQVNSSENAILFPPRHGVDDIPENLRKRSNPQFSPKVYRLIHNNRRLRMALDHEGNSPGHSSPSDYDWTFVDELLYRGASVEEAVDALQEKIRMDGRKKPAHYAAFTVQKCATRLQQRGRLVMGGAQIREAPEQAPEPTPGVILDRYPDDHRTKHLRGCPRDSLLNCETLLRLEQSRYGWRYNEFADRIELAPEAGKLSGQMFQDHNLTAIRLRMAKEHKVEFSKEMIGDLFGHVARENTYHPVRDYLNRVYQDHQEYLKTTKEEDYFLSALYKVVLKAKTEGKDGCGAEKDYSELIQRMVKCWFIGTAARVMEPGCKFEYVLLLTGDQRIGKSRFFRGLCADGSWFSDSRIDISGGRDSYSSLRGVWIWELAELSSTRKKDVEAYKSFISSSSDRYSKKYARFETEQPRQTVFGASSNEGEFLRDATGDSRTLPIKVNGLIDIDLLLKHRDLLWAEAMHLYKQSAGKGFRWWLTKEEEELLGEYQEPYKFVDSWAVTIQSQQTPGDNLSSAEIFKKYLNIDPSQQSRSAVMRLTSVLTSLGWTKKRGRKVCTISNKSRLLHLWELPTQEDS